MLILFVLAVPFTVGLIALATPWRAWVGWLSAVSNAVVLVLGVALCSHAVHRPSLALGGALRADALSSFMVVVIGTVAVLATLQTPRVMAQELAAHATTPRHANYYVALMHAFITCMLLAVVAANLGVLWVAVEATTIATTFLVSHHRTARAFEASWKYVILCSIGIALAFLGTVVLYFAALHAGAGPKAASLDWTTLHDACSAPQPGPGSSGDGAWCLATARRSASRRPIVGSPTPTAKPRRRCRH